MPTGGAASEHCAAMLGALGCHIERTHGDAEPHPDLVWAVSGAMMLTGRASDAPLVAPGPLASRARGAVQALRLLAGDARGLASIDGARLLGERAACLGLRRRGAIAPGGACRLVRARDRWVAVNLARSSDVALIPAWLEPEYRALSVDDAGNASAETWAVVRAAVAGRSARDVVDRARLLGLPVAIAGPPPAARPPWFRQPVAGVDRARSGDAVPLVVDLSALWAGPLATGLLAAAGARVIKVESVHRPDGARQGARAFYDVLNAGKESVALDLASAEGCATLRALIARADIVVESARPRALLQLGIDADALVRSVPGLVWVSITGYGRSEPEARWVAFGDDAGAAAGLAWATGDLAGGGAPLFCGDAIADPLTGMHAAAAALAAWRSGKGCLLELALRDVAAHVAGAGGACGIATVQRTGADDEWEVVLGDQRAAVRAPAARTGVVPARALGADTAAVLSDLVGVRG